MKIRERAVVLLGLLVSLLLALGLAGSNGAQPERPRPGSARPSEPMLIDDFSGEGSGKRFGTRWESVSDRVTGEASGGKIEFVNHDSRSCLHLTGSVSAKNDGGFIQARASLSSRRGAFDARSFKGIRLTVKGNGHPYALHLRTSDTRLARQFYEASFPTNEAWQDIEIPFARFVPRSLRKPLNLRTLRSVAVVAPASSAAKEFEVDIFVDEIAFYRESKMYKKLTPEEERVIIGKGTERPFTGEYTNHFEEGTYTCKQCGEKLFDSSSKFHSNCGWPSFDDQIPGTVKMLPDADGVRTEIVCAKCGGHLGHVFVGERLTPRNTRYCVNSISMGFVPASRSGGTERAIFASGCFWGTEYHLQKVPGVLSTTVGYTGGHVENPTYKQVCTDRTGHAEAVEVIYDPSKTSYEQLARLFFETHNFTQLNRQGPDVGKQYRSAVFYLDDKQKEIAHKLVGILKKKGFDVKTEITRAAKFWPAEQYHQDYYKNNGKTPYCHIYRKIF
ncbi:MAG: bifunctional methionine sulfoxide reductase B/A protein [Phycisphaerales bacterium]|nr:MAG: bifunctional methionine sulfoxide reductase B/A protein [Phycisphaerales bacterium]